MLLHYGGLDLQDVFYAISGADAMALTKDAYVDERYLKTAPC